MNKYQIPNLARACRVLSWMAGEPRPYSASDVARQFNMPRTTAFRVLRTLCAEGLLEEVGGKYVRGAGLLRLGLLALESAEIRELAGPVLQALAQSTGETAHLAVPTGHQMLILQVAESPNPIRVASRPGSLVAINCSATGKAILAAMTRERVDELLADRELSQRTARSIATLAGLEAELEKVRRQGYAIDDEEYHDGVRCLAAAVSDGHGKVVAALGITAATTRFTKRMIPTVASEVLQAAEALSQQLGSQKAGPSS